jgi:hypothetical protein
MTTWPGRGAYVQDVRPAEAEYVLVCVLQQMAPCLPTGMPWAMTLADSRSGFFHEFDRPAIEAIINAAHNMPLGHSLVQFRPLGGAMARVAPSATAFAHRDAAYMLAIVGGWEQAEHQGEAQAWVRGL